MAGIGSAGNVLILGSSHVRHLEVAIRDRHLTSVRPQDQLTLGTAFRVYWLSRSGGRVRDMLSFSRRIREISPRRVYVICGGNDLGRPDVHPYSVYLELVDLGTVLVRDYGVDLVFLSTITDRTDPVYRDFGIDRAMYLQILADHPEHHRCERIIPWSVEGLVHTSRSSNEIHNPFDGTHLNYRAMNSQARSIRLACGHVWCVPMVPYDFREHRGPVRRRRNRHSRRRNRNNQQSEN